MIIAFTLFIFIAIIETIIATLDVISIMRRRLVLNFIMVFSGSLLSLIVIRYIVLDPNNFYAMLSYSLAAGGTSVLTLHYDKVLRNHRRLKNLEKARQVKAQKQTLYTGNEGECR